MSAAVAFCFPGQGSQDVGMGRELVEAVPAARQVFETAARASGLDLARLCFEGPIEALSATDVTQPALVAVSLACLAAVAEAGCSADYVVGHSVGEYAALVAAGAVGVAPAVELVRARGVATAAAAAAAPGAMAAVIGLPDDEVERLCGGIEGVWPANYNCPGQLVVSGTVDGVAALMEAAGAAGARRTVRLNVSGGFHSPLTGAAADALRPAVEAVAFAEPSIPFFSTTSCAVEGAAAIPELLLRQLTSPVRFTQSVQRLRDLGVRTFVEVGPGTVLSGLVRRIDRDLRALSVGRPSDIERLREELDRA